MTEPAAPATKTVPSSDGTSIVFDRIGAGPPIILVGGALTSALRSFPSFVALAAALSSSFTVYTYDRRGRGDSGDTLPYAVDREIDDLEALIAQAGGAAGVHGLSSGAVLAVAAAARGAAITRLTLFEPPLPTGRADSGSAANSGELIGSARRREAVERFLSDSVGLPPEAIAALRQTPEWPRLEALAHTLAYDGAITGDRLLWTERARSVRVPVLVLDSDASPEHLRVEARMAADALPTAHHRTIAGSVHDASAQTLAPSSPSSSVPNRDGRASRSVHGPVPAMSILANRTAVRTPPAVETWRVAPTPGRHTASSSGWEGPPARCRRPPRSYGGPASGTLAGSLDSPGRLILDCRRPWRWWEGRGESAGRVLARVRPAGAGRRRLREEGAHRQCPPGTFGTGLTRPVATLDQAVPELRSLAFASIDP